MLQGIMDCVTSQVLQVIEAGSSAPWRYQYLFSVIAISSVLQNLWLLSVGMYMLAHRFFLSFVHAQTSNIKILHLFLHTCMLRWAQISD